MEKYCSDRHKARRNSGSRRRSSEVNPCPVDNTFGRIFLENEMIDSNDEEEKSCELSLQSVRQPSIQSGPIEAYWHAERDPFKDRKVTKRHSIAGNSPTSQKKALIKTMAMASRTSFTSSSLVVTSSIFQNGEYRSNTRKGNPKNIANKSKQHSPTDDVTINKKKFGYIQTKPAVRRLSNSQKANLYKDRPDLSPFYDSNSSMNFTFDAADTDSSGDDSIGSSSRSSSIVLNTARLRPRRSFVHTNRQDMWIGALWMENIGPNP